MKRGTYAIYMSISSELHVQISRNFSVHVAYGHGLVIVWWHCNTFSTSGLVDDIVLVTVDVDDDDGW